MLLAWLIAHISNSFPRLSLFPLVMETIKQALIQWGEAMQVIMGKRRFVDYQLW
jgi:hypothetical protein